MDFSLVGLGIGSLAILIGLSLRAAGPAMGTRRRGHPRPLPARVAIVRFALTAGLVLAAAGVGTLLATVIAIALGLSDRVGAIVVMAAITAGVLGGLGWGMVYARRYHPRPLPPRPVPPPARRRPPGAPNARGRGVPAQRSRGPVQPPAAPSVAQAVNAALAAVPDAPARTVATPTSAHDAAMPGEPAVPAVPDAPGSKGRPTVAATVPAAVAPVADPRGADDAAASASSVEDDPAPRLSGAAARGDDRRV